VFVFNSVLSLEEMIQVRDGTQLPAGISPLAWMVPTWYYHGYGAHAKELCASAKAPFCRSAGVFEIPTTRFEPSKHAYKNVSACAAWCEHERACAGFFLRRELPSLCYLTPQTRRASDMAAGHYTKYSRAPAAECPSSLSSNVLIKEDVQPRTLSSCGAVGPLGKLHPLACSKLLPFTCELHAPMPPSPPPLPPLPPLQPKIEPFEQFSCKDVDFSCLTVTLINANKPQIIIGAIMLLILVAAIAAAKHYQRRTNVSEAYTQLLQLYFVQSGKRQIWLRPFAFVGMCLHTIVWGTQEPISLDVEVPGIIDGTLVDDQLHAWSTAAVLIFAFCSAALLFDLLLLDEGREGRRLVLGVVVVLQATTFVLPIFLMRIEVTLNADMSQWIESSTFDHSSVLVEIAFEYVMLSRITTFYCRICLVFLLAMAPAVALAGFLNVYTAPDSKFPVLKTRILLLNCFFGAGILLASILPVVFLFQAAPKPLDLPAHIIYLWLSLWLVQWCLQLTLPLTLGSPRRFAVALGTCMFLAVFTIAGSANLDARGSWTLMSNGTFWLLLTTYIATLSSVVALVNASLQAAWEPPKSATRKWHSFARGDNLEKNISSPRLSEKPPAPNTSADSRDPYWAAFGIVCFLAALAVTWKDHVTHPTAHTVFTQYREAGDFFGTELSWPLSKGTPIFKPTMDLFDGMLTFQLVGLLLAAVLLIGSTAARFAHRTPIVRRLDVLAVLVIGVAVLAPVSVSYAWHAEVEEKCPHCGANFNQHVEALAGDTVGLTAAGFFSFRLLYSLIHLPPSMFRPLHYLLLDKTAASGKEDDAQTLRLVMRACSYLPPLFLGIPLAVVWHLAYFVHAESGLDNSQLSRDHLFTFIQVCIFFFGPIFVCSAVPNRPFDLRIQYVCYIVLYYLPLAWRLLSESCLIEPEDSPLKPIHWDGSFDQMFEAAPSWLFCYAFTWWPQTEAEWREFLRVVALTLAEIILTTIILKSLIQFVFEEQLKNDSNIFRLPRPAPKVEHPMKRLMKRQQRSSDASLKEPPPASRTTLYVASVALALADVIWGCFGFFDEMSRFGSTCQIGSWCDAHPRSINCEKPAAAVCADVAISLRIRLALSAALPAIAGLVGLIGTLIAAVQAQRAAKVLLYLWVLLLCLQALGSWLIFLQADVYAKSLCEDLTVALLKARLTSTDHAYGQPVDPQCAPALKQAALGHTWFNFAISCAMACGAALLARNLSLAKKFIIL